MGDRARELSPEAGAAHATGIDVAFRLERDSYGGQSRLVARLADLRT